MDETEYACGNFKNTVYGPEEHLSPQAKKFQRMNLQEYNKYMDKVEEFDGFDVDGCSGVINEGITPQARGSDRWDYAEHAALEQAEYGGKSIEFVSLVKANTQPVSGTMYYLTFTATEAMEHTEKTYKAKVWAYPGDGELHLMFFEDVSSNTKRDFPEKPAGKRTRGRGNKAITKVEEWQSKSGNVSRFLYSKRPTYKHTITYGEHGVSYAQHCGQFQSEAFRIYVKELMKQNSTWTYAKARKAASKKWKLMTYPEKAPIFKELNKRRNEKLKAMHHLSLV